MRSIYHSRVAVSILAMLVSAILIVGCTGGDKSNLNRVMEHDSLRPQATSQAAKDRLLGTWQERSITEAPIWTFREDGTATYALASDMEFTIPAYYQYDQQTLFITVTHPGPEEAVYIEDVLIVGDVMQLTPQGGGDSFMAGTYDRIEAPIE